MATLKDSYTLSCSSSFRDAVLALAERRHVNAGDVARSVMLVVPEPVIEAYADPGEPGEDDRETVVLKSGRAEGRPWKRKPRLQVRLPPGLSVPFIRKALNLALALDGGTMSLDVDHPEAQDARQAEAAAAEAERAREEERGQKQKELMALREEIDRLRTVISVLSFDPLPNGVTTRAEALHILGFSPYSDPSAREIRARFRMLATVHHPDSSYGNHNRMSQLNAAMEMLRKVG